MGHSNVSYKVFIEHETSRMLFEGALNADILTVLSNSEEENDWIEHWGRLAENEASEAVAAEKKHYHEFAFQSYLRGANYYRLAQYHILSHKGNIKKDNLKKSYPLYRKALDLKPNAFQAFSVDFKGQKFNGYLHLPVQFNKAQNYPTVIVTPGLGHNRESLHNFCQIGAKNGFVVVAIDGPGYGESIAHHDIKLKIREYPLFVEKVISQISELGFVDQNRIGLLGDCFGAYLSFLSATEISKVKACVLIEAILEYGDKQLKNKPLPPILTYHVHEEDHPLIAEMYKDFYPEPTKQTFSLYMVHAQIDHLIPFESAQSIFNHYSGDKHLEAVKGKQVYENYLINHYNPVLDQLEKQITKAWDWLKIKL